jgi:hypothetical protein
MKKIPTIFARDWTGDRSRVIDKPHPDCAWVFAGEGVPTKKIDGTSCLVKDNALFKRREIKHGQDEPLGFVSAGKDSETGKTVGWVPVGDGPEDKYHREAWTGCDTWHDGTYELIGPNIQGNPEHQRFNVLIRHGGRGGPSGPLKGVPLDFTGLRVWLTGKDIEGVVWHHPDGRMAKIKLRDFGIKRSTAP